MITVEGALVTAQEALAAGWWRGSILMLVTWCKWLRGVNLLIVYDGKLPKRLDV